MATKTKTRKPAPVAPIKVSVPLPPKVHMAVALAGLKNGRSSSALIAELVEKRFANGNQSPIKALKPGDGEAWKRVSVFLEPGLKNKAAQEIQRQFGADDNKRPVKKIAATKRVRAERSTGLPAAIAALVAQAYAPGYKL